ADRTGPGTRAQWQSDLARPGVGPRLRGRLSGGEALCAQASWTATSGSRRHHPHRTRRRSASRLRQWSDGARSENRQVSPDTTVCSDPWLQPQVRAPAGVAFEYAHLGRTPREGVSSFRGLSESGGSRQPGRRCGGSRHLRSHHQPAVSRCARALRRGSAALPDPRSRSKVESGVGHAKRTPLKGMRFESLEEAQAYLDRWEERWADTRIHGTTKRQVAATFAEEKPHLQALPLEPFRYYQYGERVVHLDGCVEVEAAYYSLPPGWIGRPVKVQWDELHVRVLHPHTNQLLREHLRQKRGGYRIQEEDHPKK